MPGSDQPISRNDDTYPVYLGVRRSRLKMAWRISESLADTDRALSVGLGTVGNSTMPRRGKRIIWDAACMARWNYWNYEVGTWPLRSRGS